MTYPYAPVPTTARPAGVDPATLKLSNLRVTAAIAVAAFALPVLMSLLNLLLDLEILHRLDNHTLTLAWIADAENRESIYSGLWWLTTILSLVAIGIWATGTRDRVEALGVSGFRRSKGWCLGGWFVPVIWFWFPYQCLTDNAAVRRANPGTTTSARAVPGPFLLKLFWTLWVAAATLRFVASSTLGPSATAHDLDVAVAFNAVAVTVGGLAVLALGALCVQLNRAVSVAAQRAATVG